MICGVCAKSYLCGCFNEKLPEKRYKIFSLAHSSLTAATTWPISARLSASSLEEIGLLTCARTDTRPTLPFSLLMIGDDSLLPRLEMGINHSWGSAASRRGLAVGTVQREGGKDE